MGLSRTARYGHDAFRVERHLSELAPPGVSTAVLSMDSTGVPPLFPEEEHVVRNAGPQRRREFTVGRHSARLALRGLGIAPVAVASGPGRCPLWPSGVVGSITHAAGYCAAAVAWSGHVPGIGIDLETAEDLPDEIVPLVCTTAELSRLKDLPSGTPSAKIIFSAKESAYKVLYPLTGRFRDFLEAEMTFDPALDSFCFELGGTSVHGRYRVAEGCVITIAQAVEAK
ncbi:4'-phosphopantetheinyl transferase [Streptomyces sp. NPDC059452]|uniref:4'-phosphopantetheinyl transferase family protein n=1 Tax=Streptomyces sp. NPDC059452 TaxID=3346835 RepID=UPI0036C5E9A5